MGAKIACDVCFQACTPQVKMLHHFYAHYVIQYPTIESRRDSCSSKRRRFQLSCKSWWLCKYELHASGSSVTNATAAAEAVAIGAAVAAEAVAVAATPEEVLSVAAVAALAAARLVHRRTAKNKIVQQQSLKR